MRKTIKMRPTKDLSKWPNSIFRAFLLAILISISYQKPECMIDQCASCDFSDVYTCNTCEVGYFLVNFSASESKLSYQDCWAESKVLLLLLVVIMIAMLNLACCYLWYRLGIRSVASTQVYESNLTSNVQNKGFFNPEASNVTPSFFPPFSRDGSLASMAVLGQSVSSSQPPQLRNSSSVLIGSLKNRGQLMVGPGIGKLNGGVGAAGGALNRPLWLQGPRFGLGRFGPKKVNSGRIGSGGGVQRLPGIMLSDAKPPNIRELVSQINREEPIINTAKKSSILRKRGNQHNHQTRSVGWAPNNKIVAQLASQETMPEEPSVGAPNIHRRYQISGNGYSQQKRRMLTPERYLHKQINSLGSMTASTGSKMTQNSPRFGGHSNQFVSLFSGNKRSPGSIFQKYGSSPTPVPRSPQDVPSYVSQENLTVCVDGRGGIANNDVPKEIEEVIRQRDMTAGKRTTFVIRANSSLKNISSRPS